jgi:hypothetical protein
VLAVADCYLLSVLIGKYEDFVVAETSEGHSVFGRGKGRLGGNSGKVRINLR